MTTTTTLESTRRDTPLLSRNRVRALSVAGSTLAAIAVWIVAVPLLGDHLLVRFGDGAPQSVGVGYVAGAAAVASLLGWGFLAMLERRTPRARTIWTVSAVSILVVSLSLPLSAGVTSSTKAAFIVMHLAVAAVLIPCLRRR